MRDYSCYFYHLENNKLIQNSNTACWAGLNREYGKYYNKKYEPIILDVKTKDYIYIDRYIEPEITDKQRKRIVYLIRSSLEAKEI